MLIVREPATYRSTTESRSERVAGKVALRCDSCGYEIVSYHALPPCPMCRALSWEPARWRPLASWRA